MKKLFRRNQVILTILAILVAVAGYITLTDQDPVMSENVGMDSSLLLDADHDPAKEQTTESKEGEKQVSDDPVINEQISNKEEDKTSAHPGEAVLTNGITVADFLADVRLNREQARAESKESLLAIIDNENIDDLQKEAAANQMLKLADSTEKENLLESLLRAKGFDEALVTILDDQVNVVVCAKNITEIEKAQIEDIVKQKTDLTADQIVITLMELK